MKKIFVELGFIIVSLIIAFYFFENMSWYNFGDNPANIVILRLIFFFVILMIIFNISLIMIKKISRKSNLKVRI